MTSTRSFFASIIQLRYRLRGDPAKRHEERRTKLQQARHARRERNLNLRQPTLPMETSEPLT